MLAADAWGVGPGNPEPDGALIARYLPVGSHLILAGSVLAALSLVARYYDIDVVVNRTLVYAGLSGAIALTYAAAIGAAERRRRALRAGLAARRGRRRGAAVRAAPRHLQRAVDRLIYGERHDPFAAIERLGQRLEGAVDPEAALDAVVEAVARAARAGGHA